MSPTRPPRAPFSRPACGPSPSPARVPSRTRITPLLLLPLLLTAPARAALFGVQIDTDRIAEIDPVTGAILRSFPAPDPSPLGLGGLTGADNGSALLWINSTGETTLARLTRIDPISGALLGFHDSPFTSLPQALTFDRINGIDYIVISGRGDTTYVQRGYDSTDVTELDLGAPVWSLGGDWFGRSFAICSDDTLREFNPATGALLHTLPLPFRFGVGGLAFDGRFLYATQNAAQDNALVTLIYTVDPDTAEVLHATTVAGGPIHGLAVAIPEPAFLSLLLFPTPLCRPRRR